MIFIDLETRSLADLPSLGGRGYARDPSGELLLGTAVDARFDPAPVYCWSGWLDPKAATGVSIRGWEVEPADLANIGFPADAVRWVPPEADLPEPIAEAARTGVVFVAQNADGFDRHVWAELGYPEPKWVDTLPLFSRRGLPRGLEQAGKAVFGFGKDALGHKLMQICSIPQRKGVLKGQFVPPDSARLSRVARYCARDSLLAAAIWFEEDLGRADPDDPVLALHRRINARGIPIDVDAARRLRAEDLKQQALAVRKAEEATRGVVTAKVVSSPLQLRKWLAKHGIEVLDCSRETMERVLKSTSDSMIRSVIEARLATSSITGGKIDALLRRTCPDQRLRDWAVYYGAHTGRWSSRGVQVQNFATTKVEVHEDVYDEPSQAPQVAVDEETTIAEVFKSMLRGLIIAPVEEPDTLLGVIDLAAIEARVTAWCAKDWADLQVYVRGDDPYILLANDIFGAKPGEITKKDLRRQAGKAGVLACIAEGSPVLTDRGWVRIEEVGLADRVWDGVEWVIHEGCVYQGVRECFNLNGVWLTPEHEILTPDGIWQRAECFANGQCPDVGPFSEDGRCWESNAGLPAGFVRSIFDASIVEQKKPRSIPLTWCVGSASGAVRALAANNKPHANSTKDGKPSSQIPPSAVGGRIESHRPSVGAPKKGPQDGSTMGGVGSSSMPLGSWTGLNSEQLLPGSQDTKSSTSPLTASTTTAVTNQATSAWPRVQTRTRIVVRRVFDLVNAGPRRRFQVGRLIAHNCGYQGGPNAILKFTDKLGLNLEAVGTSAERIVEAWRNQHPLVAGRATGTWKTPEGKRIVTRRGGLWRDTKSAVETIAKGEAQTATACSCTWVREGRHMFCVLPSGRPVIYRDVGWESVANKWGGMGDSITYLGARGVRIPTYGGKLVENVVQAICRDLLSDAMLALEATGIEVLMHVHDELVFKVRQPHDATYARALAIITKTPAWMEGMVVGANGEMGRRYAKP